MWLMNCTVKSSVKITTDSFKPGIHEKERQLLTFLALQEGPHGQGQTGSYSVVT